jgi:soluble lytic murein transglycosylase
MTLSAGPIPEYLFTDGLKLYQGGELGRATETWENVFPHPLYGPVAYLLLARARLEKGDYAAAEALVRDFLKRRPSSVYSDAAQQILADALCSQGKAEAVALLSRLLEKASDKDKPILTLRIADLEKRLGNYTTAATKYRALFLSHPAAVEGLKASDELAWLVFHNKIPKPEFSESEQLARAGRLYARGRFDLAADAYQTLLKAKPGDKGLTLKLARCRFKERQNQKAIDLLKDVLKGDVTEHDKMEALYLLSLAYWRIDRDKDFQLCCDTLVQKGPQRLKRKALFNLGAHCMERKKYVEAETHFKRLLSSGPDATIKADVKWRIAWIKYWERKYSEAADAFRETRALSTNGKIDNASKYWQARSLIRANRAKEAEPLLKEIVKQAPLDYYAAEALRVLKTLSITYTPDNAAVSFPDVNLTQTHSSNELVATAIKLMDKNLHEFALINLEALPKGMKSTPAIAFLCARAAYYSGKYFQAHELLAAAFGAMMENPPGTAPAEFVEIAFPRIFFSETAKIAEKHSLDPHLVWAVVRQESRYDATAVSQAGALGLMQVTPEAAGITRKAGKIPARAISDILEPKQNIAHGIRILSKNLSAFKGKLVPAVAAYNADIRKVKDWWKKNEKMHQDEFIESIPYLETRIYVKKVLAGYRAYSALHRKKDLVGLW